MDLSALLPVIDEAVGLDRLRRRMSETQPIMLGVSDGAKAAVLAALAAAQRTPRPSSSSCRGRSTPTRSSTSCTPGSAPPTARASSSSPSATRCRTNGSPPTPKTSTRRLQAIDALGDGGRLAADHRRLRRRRSRSARSHRSALQHATVARRTRRTHAAARAARRAVRRRLSLRAGGDGARRSFAPRRHHRRLAAVRRSAAAHRVLRRRRREHPDLRSGDAAIGSAARSRTHRAGARARREHRGGHAPSGCITSRRCSSCRAWRRKPRDQFARRRRSAARRLAVRWR